MTDLQRCGTRQPFITLHSATDGKRYVTCKMYPEPGQHLSYRWNKEFGSVKHRSYTMALNAGKRWAKQAGLKFIPIGRFELDKGGIMTSQAHMLRRKKRVKQQPQRATPIEELMMRLGSEVHN